MIKDSLVAPEYCNYIRKTVFQPSEIFVYGIQDHLHTDSTPFPIIPHHNAGENREWGSFFPFGSFKPMTISDCEMHDQKRGDYVCVTGSIRAPPHFRLQRIEQYVQKCNIKMKEGKTHERYQIHGNEHSNSVP